MVEIGGIKDKENEKFNINSKIFEKYFATFI